MTTLLGLANFFFDRTPVFSVMNADRDSRSRPPLYSAGLSLLPSKNFSVGKPCTPKRFPSARSASASTFAI
jgi:hypothetical protein